MLNVVMPLCSIVHDKTSVFDRCEMTKKSTFVYDVVSNLIADDRLQKMRQVAKHEKLDK